MKNLESQFKIGTRVPTNGKNNQANVDIVARVIFRVSLAVGLLSRFAAVENKNTIKIQWSTEMEEGGGDLVEIRGETANVCPRVS